MLLRVCTIALIIASSSLMSAAQKKACDLGLKVYSYDSMNSPQKRLINVTVHLKGGKFDQKLNLTDKSLNDGFISLTEGNYKLEFAKPGYKNRSKQIVLECGSADSEDEVWNYTYLWRDKKIQSGESDLITEDKSSSAKSAGSDKTPAAATLTRSSAKVFGKVTVKVLIDEDGNVISASMVDGEKRLGETAVRAAKVAKFSPTLISGVPVKVTGNVVYNFVP
ncbi:MAG: TonB family protein [Acidobacteriota bacterium]